MGGAGHVLFCRDLKVRIEGGGGGLGVVEFRGVVVSWIQNGWGVGYCRGNREEASNKIGRWPGLRCVRRAYSESHLRGSFFFAGGIKGNRELSSKQIGRDLVKFNTRANYSFGIWWTGGRTHHLGNGVVDGLLTVWRLKIC